ncbi:MAG: hypothetical protein H6625_13095 [Bdellovibrionaceae bacterium]|nr:hypothetical protein [Pseudobdellovibrionaceae bacterium]
MLKGTLEFPKKGIWKVLFRKHKFEFSLGFPLIDPSEFISEQDRVVIDKLSDYLDGNQCDKLL